MCEQVLSYDMETFFVGPRVCKNWNLVRHSKSCKPKRMDLNCIGDSEVIFPTGYQGEQGFSLQFTLDMLRKFAPEDMLQLSVGNDGNNMMLDHWDGLVQEVKRFSLLTDLSIWTDDWIPDWSIFTELPAGLLRLSFDTLTNKSGDDELQVSQNSFAVFDHLINLRFLSIALAAPFGRQYSFTDDLCLPALRELAMYDDEHNGRCYANDVTFEHIPADCSVFCRLTVCREVAKKRMGYPGYI